MSDAILVLNAGSSSLKFSAYLVEREQCQLLLKGQFEGLKASPRFIACDAQQQVIGEHRWEAGTRLTHDEAIRHLLEWSRRGRLQHHKLAAVGHRVVHGGVQFTEPVLIDAAVIAQLDELAPLAPLHQPHSISAIRTIADEVPAAPQVACFDTSFHRGRRFEEEAFALPRKMFDSGIRRYGFHGLSYEYVASRLPEFDRRAAAGRTVVAHLGSGASMCAMHGCRSVATTMGFSSLDGLPMGTRCGSLDPGVLFYLLNQREVDAESLESLLYRESGLLGVSGVSNDMRVLLESDDPRAAEAIDLFVYQIGRTLGSLAAALGGLDALVFTAGIGENSAAIRERVCRDAAWLGLTLDAEANLRGGPRIGQRDGEVTAWVIATNEELVIARHTRRVVAGRAGE